MDPFTEKAIISGMNSISISLREISQELKDLNNHIKEASEIEYIEEPEESIEFEE